MSYILDALRKSDQQRRRGGVPTLPSAPATRAAAERPAFLLYGLLGMILIAAGMAIGWLRPWVNEPSINAPVADHPLESPSRQPAPLSRARAKAEPEQARKEAPPAASASRPDAPAAAKAAVESKSPTTNIANVPDVPPPVQLASDLPLAIQQELPPMSIAMHAYSNQPRERLVSIDGRVLREGDYLTPELRLEQITPDGMIFSFRGHRFRRALR